MDRTMSDEEGELFDDDSNDDEPVVTKKRKADKSGGATKKKGKSELSKSFIDDSAELSGEEDDDDDEEEEDDENENDYIKDGFVVDEDDEEDEPRSKQPKDDLEDSDDEDDDEEEEGGKKSKKSRVRKMRDVQVLDEDDMDLINEARGVKTHRDEAREREREAEARRVRAQNEAELRKGLFHEDADEEVQAPRRQVPKQGRVERYDEDGMDDFIDDDIGDQGDILAAGGRDYDEEGGVSEAQLNEASEIFGTDYMDYIHDEEGDDEDEGFLGGGSKYKERGVGIDYGVDSDQDESDDDDDDLFGDDDDDKEALKLKRQKRDMTKAERRRQARLTKAQKQKAELRKNFEPVQLIENFCTERDDEIRMKDIPERFFDWATPYHGPTDVSMPFTDEEEEEAVWMMDKVHDIAAEIINAAADERETRKNDAISSIVHALRYMHVEKFEPAFIKRYRADIVTSEAVRNNLYAVMDQDVKWNQLITKRSTVENMLSNMASVINTFETVDADDAVVLKLREDLQKAQIELDESVQDEKDLQDQLNQLGEEDDDDDLFEDDEVSKSNKASNVYFRLLLIVILRARIKTAKRRHSSRSIWRPPKVFKKSEQNVLLSSLRGWQHLSCAILNRMLTRDLPWPLPKRCAAMTFGTCKTTNFTF